MKQESSAVVWARRLRMCLGLASRAGLGFLSLVALGFGAAALAVAAPVTGSVVYQPHSSKKLCQLTGETDHQTGRPTSSRTASRFGLDVADAGYAFVGPVPGGQTGLWWLFGDGTPTQTFRGQYNLSNRFSTNPKHGNPNALLNDPIGYSTTRGADGCPVLNFIPQPRRPGSQFPSPAAGAYTNVAVSASPPIDPIDQRTNEAPFSGITAPDGSIYAIFATDNPNCKVGHPCSGNGFGNPTRSVMAKMTNVRTLQFQALYDFSKPAVKYRVGAKFVLTSMALNPSDGYVYIWGTINGNKSVFRRSAPYLARIPASNLSTGQGLQYFTGISNGQPVFKPGEGNAHVLFRNAPYTGDKQECMSLLGVEWNPYVGRWVMIYDCHIPGKRGGPVDTRANHPRGIWMRTAPNPWGPWDAPQTIFNPVRDKATAFINYLPTKKDPHPTGDDYGPHFVPGWTTGTTSTSGRVTTVTSTFYYTIDTFSPYGQVIEYSTITLTSFNPIIKCNPPPAGCI